MLQALKIVLTIMIILTLSIVCLLLLIIAISIIKGTIDYFRKKRGK